MNPLRMTAPKSNLNACRLGVLSALAITVTVLAPLQGHAQDADSTSASTSASGVEGLIGEVVVTARKREEKAIDVPASINVFSGENLAASGVVSLNDLQYQTPGLKIATGGGGARISLRGVGTNINSGGPSVAVHMDGIYVPSPRFALTENFDTERIEVLKGPEGTLYGRNATGGAINIISRAPGNVFAADGWVGYGSNNLMAAQAGVTLPTGDRGSLRLSGAYANDDGYTKNINPVGGEVDDRNYGAARLRGHYDLTDSLSTDFTVQYSRNRGTVGYGSSNNPDSPVYASLPPQRRDIRHISNDITPHSDQKGVLLSGTITWDLGAVTLKSLTGYIDYRSESRIDIDGSGGLIAYTDSHDRSKFFSQEFQISGGDPNGLNWTSGAYFSRERTNGGGVEIDSDYPLVDPYLYTDQQSARRNRSWAVFGEVNVPVTDKFSVLLGGRYTDEKQSGDGYVAAPLFFPEPIPTVAEIKNNAFTPKLSMEYQLTDSSKLYASVTRGFKSGGVNLSEETETYDPEKIWAYEIGSKNTLADGRAELSAAAFYYDYTNLQLRSLLFTPTGIVDKITNAAKASILGFELSTVFRPTDHLSLDFNGAYLDTELKDFVSPATRAELQGVPLPLTPKTSFTVGAEYRFEMGDIGWLTARAEANYQGSVIFPQFADLDRERQSGYALINANLRYEPLDARYFVALIGRNLSNRDYLTQRYFYKNFADTEFYGASRSVEARFGFKF